MAVVELSYNDICRGCLSSNNLQPLGISQRIETLGKCIDLHITLDDGLPSKICAECWDQCSKWELFRKQCRKTDSTLRLLLGQGSSVPIEPDNTIVAGKETSVEILMETNAPNDEEGELIPIDPASEETNMHEDYDGEVEVLPAHSLEWEEDSDHVTEQKILGDDGNATGKSEATAKRVRTAPTEATGKMASVVCPQCGKSFRKESVLEAHLREHAGKKPYACKVCDMEFNGRLAFRNHTFKHTGTTYPCPDCDRTFAYPQLVEEHRKRKHTVQTKDFVCNICGKGFGRRQALEFHMLKHTDEKPVTCDVCKKRFKSQVYLNIHRVRHSETKAFKCEEQDCSKLFYTKSELNFHFRNVHSDDEDKPHRCTICPKRFVKASQLKAHMNIHPIQFECEDCPAKFATSGELRAHHLDKHARKLYQCEDCNKTFRSEKTLQTHMVKMHD